MGRVLQEKYKLYPCPYKGGGHTFESLGITEGSQVYYREFSPTVRNVVGMAKLLPRFSVGTVSKLVSRSVAYLESARTGRVVCRHVSDVVKAVAPRIGPELSFWPHLEQLRREEAGLDLIEPDEVEASKEEMRDLSKYTLTQEDVPQNSTANAEREDSGAKPKPRRSRRKAGLAPENSGL